MNALPPTVSSSAGQAGPDAPALLRQTGPASGGADFAQVLFAWLGAESAQKAPIPVELAAQQGKAPAAEPTPAKPTKQTDQPPIPDQLVALLTATGVQPTVAVTPQQSARGAEAGSDAPADVAQGRRRMPELFGQAATGSSEQAAVQSQGVSSELPIAFSIPDSVPANSRQILPEARPAEPIEPNIDISNADQSAQGQVPILPQTVSNDARVAAPAANVQDVGMRLGTPAFADDLGNRVVWMAGHNQQAAEFRIDPPHLGPVEVRLALSNDQASLVLLSPHANVREALQSTLPRLQELLGAAGIQLGSVHVGTQGGREGGYKSDQSSPRAPIGSVGAIDSHDITAISSGWLIRGTGVVDTYA